MVPANSQNAPKQSTENCDCISRQPPQLNCPSDSVLLLDFYAGVSQISSFRREVFHWRTKIFRFQCSLLCSTVKIRSSVPSYSKAPRGLFVQVRVGRIFTAISISPGNGSRQSLSRSTFRAGRNLPDTMYVISVRLLEDQNASLVPVRSS